MPTFLEEAALLKPVEGSLRRRGFRRQQPELQFFEYSIDLYAYSARRDLTVAVELKLYRWMRAFQQALVYQLCADYAYLAMPIRSAAKVDVPLLRKHGLGLIGVHPGARCAVLLEAEQSTVVMPSYRDFYVRMMQEQ